MRQFLPRYIEDEEMPSPMDVLVPQLDIPDVPEAPEVSPEYQAYGYEPNYTDVNSIRSERDRALERAQRQSTIGHAVAGLASGLDRTFSGISGLPQDPTGGVGLRRIADLPMRTAQAQAEGYDAQIADALKSNQAERTKATDLGRGEAIRRYIYERYGKQVPGGLGAEEAGGLAQQMGVDERSRRNISSNEKLAQEGREDRSIENYLDRQNRLEIARMRRRGGSGSGGGTGNSSQVLDALERAGVERSDASALSPKKRQEVLAAAGRSQVASDRELATVEVEKMLHSYQKEDENDFKNMVGINAFNKRLENFAKHVGPLEGRTPTSAKEFFAWLGDSDSQEAVTLRQDLVDISANYKRSQTGLAMTDAERKVLDQIISLKATPEVLRHGVEIMSRGSRAARQRRFEILHPQVKDQAKSRISGFLEPGSAEAARSEATVVETGTAKTKSGKTVRVQKMSDGSIRRIE